MDADGRLIHGKAAVLELLKHQLIQPGWSAPPRSEAEPAVATADDMIAVVEHLRDHPRPRRLIMSPQCWREAQKLPEDERLRYILSHPATSYE